MFRVSRSYDDGRMFFKGCRFVKDSFTTESKDIANAAIQQGWKVSTIEAKEEVLVEKEIVPEVPKEYVCDICGKVLTNNTGLSAHKRFGHK